ncbi:hypothetical protein B0H17DRAFT_1162621 [Mycena rosella]|uniref:Protein kinase domain-containing protein n=1 Tax=Mycena rosella TaxID=1033263 RepID=A0AAD7CVZ8_MYCRO|nr:hypothetical protein B0H17DRAFT_1162621 [Mycena rosella]
MASAKGFARSEWFSEDEANHMSLYEVEIGVWFSAEPQQSHPNNHCPPGEANVQIIVMPLLTEYNKPRFVTIGEAKCRASVCSPLQNIPYSDFRERDCTHSNIMMDASPIFTTPFHPAQHNMKRDFSGKTIPLSRTQHPVKYFITDFGYSCQLQADDAPNRDSFPVDIYYLGKIIKIQFIEGDERVSRKHGFEFMKPLVIDMVNTGPSLRPDMDEVVERFEETVGRPSSWKLRSRVAKDKHSFGIFISIAYWIRRVQLVIGRYPAIPMP